MTQLPGKHLALRLAIAALLSCLFVGPSCAATPKERPSFTPDSFTPVLSAEKKAELLKRYVSGLVVKDQNLQTPPVGGWRDFNAYIYRTAPFFDASDRKQIIAEVLQRSPGVFFKDAVPGQGGSVQDVASGKEINTVLPRYKSGQIGRQDMWPVLYNYLEELKSSKGEFSYPPVSYRYEDMDMERMKRIVSRVRPDLRPGDLELEDAVAFLDRKGFFSGKVTLSRREFAKDLALCRHLNSLRNGTAPALGKNRTLENYLRQTKGQLGSLALSEDDLARLKLYLAQWGVIDAPVRVKEKQAEVPVKTSVATLNPPAVAPEENIANPEQPSGPLDAGDMISAPAVSEVKQPAAPAYTMDTTASAPGQMEDGRAGAGATANVFARIVDGIKNKFFPKSGKTPAREGVAPSAPNPESAKAQEGRKSVLDGFILPEELREEPPQAVAGVAPSSATATSTITVSEGADFYGSMKSDLLKSDGTRKPPASLQEYELHVPLLADGVVYPGYDQLLFAANAELAKQPKSPKSLLKRADANYGLKRYADALRDAESSLRIQRELHGFEIMAWALYKQGQDEKAYRATTSGLAMSPDATELLLVAVKASERQGRYMAMLEDLEKAAEVDQAQFGRLFEQVYDQYGDSVPEFQPTLLPHLKNSSQGFWKTFKKRFSRNLPYIGLVVFVVLIIMAIWSSRPKAEEGEFEPISEDDNAPNPADEGILGGRYKPEALLYHDPGGIVYKGIDLASETPIVINKFQVELPREQKRRLLKEKNKLLSLNHPNIGFTYEILDIKENFYIITDLVGGINLDEKLSHEPFIMSFSEARKMCVDILRALEYLHARHIIYGVLRPTDIQINQEGIARLINVGIGSVIDRNNNRWIAYIAPEALGGHYTVKSDFYALGVCFYRAVTGVVPDTSGLDIHAKPPSKMVKTLPKNIDRFFDDLLSSEPLRRPDNAAEFQAKLENL